MPPASGGGDGRSVIDGRPEGGGEVTGGGGETTLTDAAAKVTLFDTPFTPDDEDAAAGKFRDDVDVTLWK